MRGNTRTLRLGPLPNRESVRLTFVCTGRLKADLERYATLHAQTYGEAADAVTLIPLMLEAFMARDRAFRRQQAGAMRTRNSDPSGATP
jgi:hypothetical protein